MSTLQQLIDANPNKLILVTDDGGTTQYKFNYIDGSNAVMYDASSHDLNEDKWDLHTNPIPLNDYKKAAKLEIDLRAGEARKRYVTHIAGQDATYQRKEKHAQRFKDDGYPEADINLKKYRYVKAEVDAHEGALTGEEAADLILGTADQWDTLNQAIEMNRLLGKRHVDAETTHSGVDSEKQSAITILDAI